MKANPTAKKATSGPGNYADQVNDATTVLGWRKKNGIKEEVDLDEAPAKVWHLANKKFSLISDKDGYTLVKQGSGEEKKLKAKTPADATAELVKKGYKEEVDLDEGPQTDRFNARRTGKEGTVKIIKNKDGKFQIQKMTKGKFVDIGKPYNSQKEAEKFRSGQPDLFGEGAAADARRAMSKDKDFSRRDSADDDTAATDDDVKAASKNILMQLRKAISLKSFNVEFGDGKHKVDAKIAQAVQNKYNSMRRPADKEKYQMQIAKSYKGMLQSLKAGYHGEQKESILSRIDKKLKERKNG
jgi:hypothetical protein